VGVIFNITESRKNEEDIRKFLQVVEQSPMPIIITDRNGNIEYVNSAFSTITGYSFGEVMGKNPRILKSGLNDEKVYRELWNAIRPWKRVAREFHNRKKNNALYWEYAHISALKMKRMRSRITLAIKEDITLRKAMEDELRQSRTTVRELLDAISGPAISVPFRRAGDRDETGVPAVFSASKQRRRASRYIQHSSPRGSGILLKRILDGNRDRGGGLELRKARFRKQPMT
jgi:PAS domain S-box-containing protein